MYLKDCSKEEEDYIDKINNDSYNRSNIKEDITMSSIVLYNYSDGTIIASDSRNTHIKVDKKGNITQYNYNDNKQKLFEFNNGIIGIYGTTTFYDKQPLTSINSLPVEIEKFLRPLLNKELTPDDVEQFCISMQPHVINNNETTLLCVFQNSPNNIVKSFTFSSREITIRSFPITPNFISFAVFFIKEPSVSLYQELEEGKENKVREIMKLYIKTENYTNNYPRIGGPIQMYKISSNGILNLCDKDAPQNNIN